VTRLAHGGQVVFVVTATRPDGTIVVHLGCGRPAARLAHRMGQEVGEPHRLPVGAVPSPRARGSGVAAPGPGWLVGGGVMRPDAAHAWAGCAPPRQADAGGAIPWPAGPAPQGSMGVCGCGWVGRPAAWP